MRDQMAWRRWVVVAIASWWVLLVLVFYPPLAPQSRAIAPNRIRRAAAIARSRGCPSLPSPGRTTEHNPLVLEGAGAGGADLLICRNPKVASLSLRIMALARHENRSWRDWDDADDQARLPTLPDTRATTRHRLLFAEDGSVERLMWVRHPVERVLSAFLEVGHLLGYELAPFKRNRCPAGRRRSPSRLGAKCIDCLEGRYNHGGMVPSRTSCFKVPDGAEFLYAGPDGVACNAARAFGGVPIYVDGEYETGCVACDESGCPPALPSIAPTPTPTPHASNHLHPGAALFADFLHTHFARAYDAGCSAASRGISVGAGAT